MIRLLWIVVLASVACRLLTGRWPWDYLSQLGGSRGESASIRDARRLLGVRQGASRQDIVEAHRRLIASVHPDRGGSNAQVHEANQARDALLSELDNRSQIR